MTVADTYSGASVTAHLLLRQLLELGLNHVIVCPGSRSQALALAAAAAETAQQLQLHVAVDERSAAFYALGVARETARPAAVIVTSGSAVGNLLPAVMEAHAGRVPLLLLTADRPARLHGRRANQTIRQQQIFTPFLRAESHFEIPATVTEVSEPVAGFCKAVATLWQAACGIEGGQAAGPVQLNLGVDEPLAGAFPADVIAAPTAVDAAALAAADGSFATSTQPYEIDSKFRTVILAGAGAGKAAEEFAYNAKIPLLAEVVSNSRFGRQAVSCYQTLLADPQTVAEIERVVVFGHPTLNRETAALVAAADKQVIVVDPHTSEQYGPEHALHVSAVKLAADYDDKQHYEWLGMWIRADRYLQRKVTTIHEPDTALAKENGYKERNEYARQEVAAKRQSISREFLAESVWLASWPHDRLVVAASRMVRVLDRVAPPRPNIVHANRGVAGIDGTIATALGVAVASQASPDPAQAAGVTRVLIGDLALLHDAGSLALTPGEDAPRIQLFVVNDNGGSLFSSLEVKQRASAADFTRVVTAPHTVDIAALAAAYGWQYRKLSTRGELTEMLTAPLTAPEIIEIELPQE